VNPIWTGEIHADPNDRNREHLVVIVKANEEGWPPFLCASIHFPKGKPLHKQVYRFLGYTSPHPETALGFCHRRLMGLMADPERLKREWAEQQAQMDTAITNNFGDGI
jgi:hypothetical protein